MVEETWIFVGKSGSIWDLQSCRSLGHSSKLNRGGVGPRSRQGTTKWSEANIHEFLLTMAKIWRMSLRLSYRRWWIGGPSRACLTFTMSAWLHKSRFIDIAPLEQWRCNFHYMTRGSVAPSWMYINAMGSMGANHHWFNRWTLTTFYPLDLLVGQWILIVNYTPEFQTLQVNHLINLNWLCTGILNSQFAITKRMTITQK